MIAISKSCHTNGSTQKEEHEKKLIKNLVDKLETPYTNHRVYWVTEWFNKQRKMFNRRKFN